MILSFTRELADVIYGFKAFKGITALSVEERLKCIEKLEWILALLEELRRSLNRELLNGLNWRPYPSGEDERPFADGTPPDLINTLEKATGLRALRL